MRACVPACVRACMYVCSPELTCMHTQTPEARVLLNLSWPYLPKTGHLSEPGAWLLAGKTCNLSRVTSLALRLQV